jgi:ubiquinone/menaquinone biosynthesis C-methylase UbiE
MNPEEYSAMAAVEREHWFYRGKRAIVRHWIHKFVPDARGNVLIDCGCGTGIFAAEMQESCVVIGIDDHEEALAFARINMRGGTCRRGTTTAIPQDDASVDIVTLLDVLEHIPDDRKALHEIHRVLKPGGLLVLTVPAFPTLWSDWDEVLHHCRRYRAPELIEKVRTAGFSVEHWNHTNVLAFPFVLLIRKLRRVLPMLQKRRMEDRIPSHMINALLQWQFVYLACQNRIRFPFGVSLLLIARKNV